MFNTLYKEICIRVCRKLSLSQEGSGSFILPSGSVALLRKDMVKQFAHYLLVGATEAHRQLLAQCQEFMSQISSEDTCFSCNSRRPQYGLPCIHSVCQNCVLIFGTTSSEDSHLIHLNECLLCGADTHGFCVRVKPDTASVRVLSFDGGGTRGLASLGFFQVLQDSVGLPYPVQRNFDVVYGTSSGKCRNLVISRVQQLADQLRIYHCLRTLHQRLVR